MAPGGHLSFPATWPFPLTLPAQQQEMESVTPARRKPMRSGLALPVVMPSVVPVFRDQLSLEADDLLSDM